MKMDLKEKQIVYVDGKPHIKAKVVILPVQISDLLLIGDWDRLCLRTVEICDLSKDEKCQNLYIISDEEIQELPWDMEWITLLKFPDYEINMSGDVRNKDSKRILSKSLSTKGYYQINIANKCRRIHRLLAETFIENPDNLETVNHIDGNKLNNDLSNLEWLSRNDNVKHSRDVLKLIPIPYSKSNKIHHSKGKTGHDSNRGIKIKATLLNGEIKIFGSALEAARELFNDESKGKQIRQAIKRNSKSYQQIKFENYESDN